MIIKVSSYLKGNELLRSFLGIGGIYIFGIPLGLVINILLARYLGSEEFGQYAFVISLVTLLALPASGGLPNLLTREIAQYSNMAQWALYRGALRAAHCWVLLVSVIILATYYVAYYFGWVLNYGKWGLMSTALLLIPLQGLNSVRSGTLKGLGYPAISELPMQTLHPVLFLTGIGLLITYGALSVNKVLSLQIIVTGITFIIGSALLLICRPKISVQYKVENRKKYWLQALLPFTLVSVVGTFNAQIVTVILGLFSDDTSVAMLRVADRGAQFVILALGLINLVVAPKIVKLHQEHSNGELQKLSRESTIWILIVASSIAALFIFFGRPLISLLFGVEYSAGSYMPIVIMSVGYLATVSFGPSAPLLAMTGNENSMLMCQLYGLLALVMMSVILIPIYGTIGAALSIAVGQVVWNGSLGYYVFKVLDIRPGIY